ncbi:MAG TPA: PfkB family carbohydrate kinase [Pseudonocardia sp.]|uniref:PfkB family carbohydrate kinase n=1 Tax=Pseudonocardia sp. TaxID=60912 RepID=UPI002C9CA3A9|nr:PfkB family carbohydrate kinase [Pseudonocardia sp.]HTF54767.1 PfkB family carbohydrate kinase [Pseudonocardia sp.]
MTAGPLVVVGDTLYDLDISGSVTRHCPDAASAPVLDAERALGRPGGAGLAAVLAAATGIPVRLVTALAADREGDWLADILGERVELVAGPVLGATCLKVRMLDRGRPLVRVDHGQGTAGPVTSDMLEALEDAGAVLLADYGRGISADPELAKALAGLCERVPVVWDPHPRGVAPVPGCAMVTPNLAEARRALHPTAIADQPGAAALDAARLLPERWYARSAAVTAGALGAAVAVTVAGERPDAELIRAAPAPERADPCGAGDCFAAALAVALLSDADPVAAARAAVANASEFVRCGGAAAVRLGTAPPRLPQRAQEGHHEPVY